MPHILGQHAQHIITTAHDCQPNTHTPDQTRALLDAILDCIDLAGGATQASSPRFDTSPDKPALANRTRASSRRSVPMNPVARHHATGHSQRPPGDLDSNYWRHQYNRMGNHHDRCEVVRRAATHLAGLIARDPNAPQGDWTEDDLETDILINGAGWPPSDVAQRYHVTTRTVELARIDDDRHPLTGQHWTPPEHNTFAAAAAREMRAAGMNSTDIGRALNRNANTIRAWTTHRRLAA